MAWFAIPSIIFGLWGLQVLMASSEGVQRWMSDYLGWTVVFKNTLDLYGKVEFTYPILIKAE